MMTNMILADDISWHYPSVYALLLLLLLPFLGYMLFSIRNRAAVAVSDTETANTLNKTWRMRLMWLPPVLRLLAIALVIVAVARPQIGNAETRTYAKGIAIELLLDRSGSMQAMDFKLDNHPVSRLEAVKDVAMRFIKGNEDNLEGREHDLIGLITFARYADQTSPMTLDHRHLVRMLKETQIARPDGEGSSTAIGDAVGLAVERIDALSTQIAENSEEQLQGKVIILLTDGENNAGDLDPIQAAKVAETLGIKIYTIGVGTTGRAPFPVTDPFGRRTFTWQPVRIDEATLQEMAKITGGEYFRATDTESLEKIYERIDELEKTEIEEQRFVDYHELAIKPLYMGWGTLPPILVMAFAALALEILLRQTILRRVP